MSMVEELTQEKLTVISSTRNNYSRLAFGLLYITENVNTDLLSGISNYTKCFSQIPLECSKMCLVSCADILFENSWGHVCNHQVPLTVKAQKMFG